MKADEIQRVRILGSGMIGLAMLDVHRQRQEAQKTLAGDSWKENGMIFTTSIGTDIDQTKVSREFKQILR